MRPPGETFAAFPRRDSGGFPFCAEIGIRFGKGEIFDFARNAIPRREGDEFAGATFSSDGQVLFVNIQASSGLTFAIWGPFEKGAL